MYLQIKYDDDDDDDDDDELDYYHYFEQEVTIWNYPNWLVAFELDMTTSARSAWKPQITANHRKSA